ncbi:hypothetical protein Tco_0356421 [Tanacetum coccineum]
MAQSLDFRDTHHLRKKEEEEEEKEESEKKGSKEASEIGSNSESPGYAAFDNEVESDLESTTRSKPKSVILCGSVRFYCTLAESLVAPKVGAVPVILPTRVLDLDSLLVAPKLPLVLPFLCTDDSKADSESGPAKQRPKRHGSLTPSSEFPHAPVVAPPGIHRRPTILRVGPYLARRLAWRRVSHHSSDRHSSLDFTSDSSSSSSSLDSLSDISSGSSSDSLSDTSSVHSLGCDASGQSHSGPSTRVASPRLVDPPVRTP